MCIALPFQVLCNKDPQELKAGDLLHFFTIDDEGARCGLMPSEVHSDFLCFPNIKGQVVVFALSC